MPWRGSILRYAAAAAVAVTSLLVAWSFFGCRVNVAGTGFATLASTVRETLPMTSSAEVAHLLDWFWGRTGVEAVSEEVFLQWMANGGVALSKRGHEVTVQELKPKLVMRVLAFCKDVLPPAMTAAYAADLAEVLGVDLDAQRPLMSGEVEVKRKIHEEFHLPGYAAKSSAPYSFFGFMPHFTGRAVPGKGPISFPTRCWKAVTVEAKPLSQGGWQLEVQAAGHIKVLCSETLVFFSASHFHAVSFTTPLLSHKVLTFKSKGLSESDVWDVTTLGIRSFTLPVSLLEAVHNLMETALLFIPVTRKDVSPRAAARNAAFLHDYVGVAMAPRKQPGKVVLDESHIHSGDMFGIIRLDGLDPMLAWGMGSRTGHVTVALWEAGSLYIAESTVNSTYWPTNGIQRTPYRKWLQQAEAAGYNVVHLPLAEKYRSRFDVAKANQFFHDFAGLEYGYQALFSGWIDTERHNYPCKPPYDAPAAEKQCLEWEVLEAAVPLVTKLIPSFDRPFLPTWNLHVTGSAASALSATELYRIVHNKGQSLASIPAVVESDDHTYPSIYNNGTTTPGPAMVCDVFVCRVWKAGGVFQEISDDFSCAEQTNIDVYALDVLEVQPSTSPGCPRDSGSPLCQLTGTYQLQIPNAATRRMYKHMQETCPTEPPLYARPDNC